MTATLTVDLLPLIQDRAARLHADMATVRGMDPLFLRAVEGIAADLAAVTADQPTVNTAWWTRCELGRYRAYRKHLDPYRASREIVDGAARFLADKVLVGADRHTIADAAESYRIARAIHETVCQRADIGGTGRPFADLTVREQYWQIGVRAGSR